MPESRSGQPRRSYAIPLLVVAVAAAGFNLRTAIASLPPLFPELQTRLHLSSAALSLLAATPVICFGVASAFAAWLNRRFGEEAVLRCAMNVARCARGGSRGGRGRQGQGALRHAPCDHTAQETFEILFLLFGESASAAGHTTCLVPQGE